MRKLVITTDLGHFKAFLITRENPELDSPRIELLKSFDNEEATNRYSERISDSAGRFKRSDSADVAGRAGFGENHKVEQETRTRIIKAIAENINRLVKKEKDPPWSLAAPEEINRQIVELIDPGVKSKMKENVKADLTSSDKKNLLARFAS